MPVSVCPVYGGGARYHWPMRRYDAAEIEPKWQQVWEDEGLYRASDDPDDPRPRFYALDMFPYPSGDLHLGHAEAFSGGDVIARFRWLQGYNVLHPIGWDSFGLPAENAAIKRGIHPKRWTYENIEQQAASFKRMGFSFDWTRRLHSSDPEYYRWTQWLFLKLFEMGLAYRKNAPANWCPNDQTVLANEQVINGICERCGTAVVRKDLTQWFFKITDYAQRLLDDVDTLEEWPERVITMQRNWIGRSEGATVRFTVEETGDEVEVFTTRPDTLWGVTFFVFAARASAGRRSWRRREAPRSGSRARGPAPGDAAHEPRAGREPRGRAARRPRREPRERGARAGVRRAVRADGVRHGRRDGRAGARSARLRVRARARPGVRVVIQPPGEERDAASMTEAHDHEGVMVHSGPFDGEPSPESIGKVAAWLEEQGLGRSRRHVPARVTG